MEWGFAFATMGGLGNLKINVIRDLRKEVYCVCVCAKNTPSSENSLQIGRVFFAPFRASIKTVESLSKCGSDFTIQEHTRNKPNSTLNYPAQI